jgi:hypothetical protein
MNATFACMVVGYAFIHLHGLVFGQTATHISPTGTHPPAHEKGLQAFHLQPSIGDTAAGCVARVLIGADRCVCR